MDKDKTIIITTEDGKELTMEILFTFEFDNKNFVVYFNPNDDQEQLEVFASIYDDEGNLTPIDDDKYWDKVEEMLENYSDSIEECDEDCDCCEHHCDHDHK